MARKIKLLFLAYIQKIELLYKFTFIKNIDYNNRIIQLLLYFLERVESKENSIVSNNNREDQIIGNQSNKVEGQLEGIKSNIEVYKLVFKKGGIWQRVIVYRVNSYYPYKSTPPSII